MERNYKTIKEYSSYDNELILIEVTGKNTTYRVDLNSECISSGMSKIEEANKYFDFLLEQTENLKNIEKELESFSSWKHMKNEIEELEYLTDGLLLSEDESIGIVNSRAERLNEVLERMKDYCDRYNELRFDDDRNNQHDIDRNWIKERFPDHKILDYAYNDLDTRRDKIQHSIPMKGLQKDFTIESIMDWMGRMNKELGVVEFVLGYKYDGAACTAIYDNKGMFKKAATRGNGNEGDDITENFKMFRGFIDFERLAGISEDISNQIDSIELRGEVLCTKKMFEKHKELGIKNTRQFAAGSMKLKDTSEVKRRELVFIPFQILFIKDGKRISLNTNSKQGITNQKELKYYFKGQGIDNEKFIGKEEANDLIDISKFTAYNTHGTGIEHNTAKDYVERLFNHYYELREDLNVDIDGLVFKINDYEKQIEAGEDQAMALKFPSESSKTKVTGITFQTGRTGRITPVLEYEPVDILGVTCSRATIHNSDYFEEYQLRIGDEISVARNGDVIPQLQSIVKRNEKNEPIEFIKNCEVCGSKLERDGAFHYCKNENCGAKIDGRIYSFIGAIGLNFLGGSKVEEMIEEGILKDSYDILNVTEEQLLSLDRSGQRTVDKIMNSLNECKEDLTFSHILMGLGVGGLGWRNSYKISSFLGERYGNKGKYKDRMNILKESINDGSIYEIDGIGDSNVSSINERLKDTQFFEYTAKTCEEFKIDFDIEEENEEGKLSGKTFYLTGKLSLPRKKFAEKYIYENGGEEESMKKADYILIGEKPTQWKVDEAKEIGKSIITELEFMKLIK